MMLSNFVMHDVIFKNIMSIFVQLYCIQTILGKKRMELTLISCMFNPYKPWTNAISANQDKMPQNKGSDQNHRC